jgi:hypothetical protein
VLAAVLTANAGAVVALSEPPPAPPAVAAPAAPPPAVAAVAPTSAPPTSPAPPPPPRPGKLRLRVPALGLDTATEELRTHDTGALEVPDTARGVGWYAHGAVPGDVGPAVFAAHVDLDGRAGAFHRLATMAAGDVVDVVRPDGEQVRFVVTRVEQYPKDAFPTDAVYGPTDGTELRLVTCGGSFDRTRRSYRDNVVVFAVPAGP